MKRIIRAFAICWAIFSLAASALAQPTEISLRIIGMNDFHGALVETSSYAGAAKVASAVENLKREANDRAIVLSAGDMMQGSIESNLERGRTVIEMMNVIGVDAMTLGNHEFDWGLEVLQERVGEMQFDCLGANITERESGRLPRWLKSYTMLERDGIQIGVVGLVTMDTATSVNPKHIRTLKIADPMTTARDAVRKARAEGADIIILLVHMACYQDEMTGRLSGEAAELAAIDGIDVIVSGHSHTLINGYADDTCIVQAGAKGTYLDVVDIVYSIEQKKIVSCQTELYKADGKTLQPCRKTEAAVKRAVDRCRMLREQTAGHVSCDLTHDRRAVSPLGSWVSDAVRSAVDADIALQNGGGIRVDLLKAGAVTNGELYEMLPFDNTICTAYLTGTQIKDVLEQGLFDEEHSILQCAGMSVVCDSRKPQGSRVVSVHLADGRPLVMDKKYFVAYNDFMAEGGDGYPHLSQAEGLNDTGIGVREAVGEYLRTQKGKVSHRVRFYTTDTAQKRRAA